ncbi:histidine phosphatase family protein [Chengkuizengella marina]|uniref:histidine phosphatase family protein n=1 Tax=Chengkuizengella marina TaxID=2507566 RepID=UPI002E2D0178|nr:histidine phosphatase family protein [Chengkuizengella marina]
MTKNIYIVRHCKALGQSSESKLSEQGFKQAQYLPEFFSNIKVDRIISSPFLRAIQSAKPISKNKKIQIEIDNRLSERVLSIANLPDWFEKLKATFDDVKLKYEGGESSQEAMNRIAEVMDSVLTSEPENTIIVTHGNLMSLLLMKYNKEFGFECWKNLSNPDVFLLSNISNTKNNISIERIWKENV